MAAPPPVPALPDTARLTTYSITAQVGPFDVGFHIYGDGTDYQNWIEVWLNGARLIPGVDWYLNLSTGTLATAARPLQNARVTLTTPSTGTLLIVGDRRPRRLSQFSENDGVSARDLNLALTDIIAVERELWDRGIATGPVGPPGPIGPAGPIGPTGASGNGTGNVVGPAGAVADHLASYNGVTGTIIKDSGIAAADIVGLRRPVPATTFYFATTGSDATGDGTSGNPWLSPGFGRQYIKNNYDTRGQSITFQLGAGTFICTNQFDGALVGGGNLLIQGAGGTLSYTTKTATFTTGATLTGGSSGATAKVTRDSASAAVASTVGTLSLVGVTGTFQNNEIITDSEGGSATVSGTFSGTTGLTIIRPPSVLNYDTQTANFTVGATLTGATSGVTALIHAQADAGTSGTLTLKQISDTSFGINNVVGFVDNEVITDSSGGSALANGGLVSSGYSFSCVDGAIVTLRNMKFDATDAWVDSVVMGNGGTVYFSDGIIWGNALNFANDFSNSSGYSVFQNEYAIDKDVVSRTGTITNGSNTITAISNMAGIRQYMGVRGPGIPNGAFVNTVNRAASTVTLAYVLNSPITAPVGTTVGATISFDYGGQCHVLLGDSARCYFNTNGDPLVDFRIMITNNGVPCYTSAFIQSYIGSTINAQGLRFIPSVASQGGGGRCNAIPFSCQRRGIIDTNFQGLPYFPGTASSSAITTITTTAGSKSATLGANNGVFKGQVPSVYRQTTGSWTEGAVSFTVANATGIRVGDKIIGKGLRAGITVSNVVGTTITMPFGARQSSGGVTDVWFINTQTSAVVAFEPGTFLQNVVGTAVTLSKEAASTITAEPVYCGGHIDSDGAYD